MRRLVPDEETETRVSVAPAPSGVRRAADRMAAWAGVDEPEPRRKPARGRRQDHGRGLVDAVAEAEDLREAGDWSTAEARHLVGLYALCHDHVYGVMPEELRAAFPAAVASAAKLLREDFSGDVSRAVVFVRWVWARENARERRRTAGEGAFRIGWRLMFASRALLTDWKVDGQRAARAATSAAR
jgi:hypothetical protein